MFVVCSEIYHDTSWRVEHSHRFYLRVVVVSLGREDVRPCQGYAGAICSEMSRVYKLKDLVRACAVLVGGLPAPQGECKTVSVPPGVRVASGTVAALVLAAVCCTNSALAW